MLVVPHWQCLFTYYFIIIAVLLLIISHCHHMIFITGPYMKTALHQKISDYQKLHMGLMLHFTYIFSMDGLYSYLYSKSVMLPCLPMYFCTWKKLNTHGLTCEGITISHRHHMVFITGPYMETALHQKFSDNQKLCMGLVLHLMYIFSVWVL